MSHKMMEASIKLDSETDLSTLWRRICWYGGAHLYGCDDNKYLIKANGGADEVMKVINTCVDLGVAGKVYASFE